MIKSFNKKKTYKKNVISISNTFSNHDIVKHKF